MHFIASLPQTVFDESGHFLLYPTLVGIKSIISFFSRAFFLHSLSSVFNIVTNRVVRLIGKNENLDRFVRMSLYQGKTQGTIAIPQEL